MSKDAFLKKLHSAHASNTIIPWEGKKKKRKKIGLVNPLHPKLSLWYLCCHHNMNKQQSKTNYSWTIGLYLQQQNYAFVLELLINILDYLLSDSYFAWHRGKKGQKALIEIFIFISYCMLTLSYPYSRKCLGYFRQRNFFYSPAPFLPCDLNYLGQYICYLKRKATSLKKCAS